MKGYLQNHSHNILASRQVATTGSPLGTLGLDDVLGGNLSDFDREEVYRRAITEVDNLLESGARAVLTKPILEAQQIFIEGQANFFEPQFLLQQ